MMLHANEVIVYCVCEADDDPEPLVCDHNSGEAVPSTQGYKLA